MNDTCLDAEPLCAVVMSLDPFGLQYIPLHATIIRASLDFVTKTIEKMKLDTLKDLYIHELKDLYSAERQIIKALPKMVKAAINDALASGFQEHLEQTREHADRPSLRTYLREVLGRTTPHWHRVHQGWEEK